MKKMVISLLVVLIMTLGINVISSGITKESKYDIEKNLVEQMKDSLDNYKTLNQMPQDLKDAIVAVEDRRFYDHGAFDLIGISRAFYKNFESKRFKEGGSTITQQLAKNMFFSNERSIDRKIKELLVAIRLEREYSKDEILEMYLNVIYLGEGAYGVGEASEAYFGKDVEHLDLGECAMLAGLPKAPSIYAPTVNYDKAKDRQHVVLHLMEKNNYINDMQKKLAKNMKLNLN